MRVTIHRITQEADDAVGGAQHTGTAIYENIAAAVQYLKPSTILLEQGLEIKRMARVMVQPGSLTIFERDELEVVGPPGHEDIGNFFRVAAIDRTGLSPNDPRARHLVLTCERMERGRDTRVTFQ
jgi:hypothetical protein